MERKTNESRNSQTIKNERENDVKKIRIFLYMWLLIAFFVAPASDVMAKSAYLLGHLEWDDYYIEEYEIPGHVSQNIHWISSEDGFQPRNIAVWDDPDGDRQFDDAQLLVLYRNGSMSGDRIKIEKIDATTFDNIDWSEPYSLDCSYIKEVAKGFALDKGKRRIYVMSQLGCVYVFDADTLLLVSKKSLSSEIGLDNPQDIALDEKNDWLFVADDDHTVHYFDTNNWNEVDILNFSPAEEVKTIAVDGVNGRVYASGTDEHDEEHHLLFKYDMKIDQLLTGDVLTYEHPVDLAVDPNYPYYLYVAHDYDSAYVFDRDLGYVGDRIDSTQGSPRGICIGKKHEWRTITTTTIPRYVPPRYIPRLR